MCRHGQEIVPMLLPKDAFQYLPHPNYELHTFTCQRVAACLGSAPEYTRVLTDYQDLPLEVYSVWETLVG